MKKYLITLFVILVFNSLAAEEVYNDSTFSSSKSPLKAGLLSAVIPGAGQIYNSSYLKAGVTITLEGLFLRYFLKNDDKSKKYYDKWKESNSQIDYDQYEFYYEKRQNYLWWLGISIFISTFDAITDAYLHDFDDQKEKIRLQFEDKGVRLEYKFKGPNP